MEIALTPLTSKEIKQLVKKGYGIIRCRACGLEHIYSDKDKTPIVCVNYRCRATL